MDVLNAIELRRSREQEGTEYCAQHASEGMVDVYSKKCAGDGCSKQPEAMV